MNEEYYLKLKKLREIKNKRDIMLANVNASIDELEKFDNFIREYVDYDDPWGLSTDKNSSEPVVTTYFRTGQARAFNTNATLGIYVSQHDEFI